LDYKVLSNDGKKLMLEKEGGEVMALFRIE